MDGAVELVGDLEEFQGVIVAFTGFIGCRQLDREHFTNG